MCVSCPIGIRSCGAGVVKFHLLGCSRLRLGRRFQRGSAGWSWSQSSTDVPPRSSAGHGGHDHALEFGSLPAERHARLARHECQRARTSLCCAGVRPSSLHRHGVQSKAGRSNAAIGCDSRYARGPCCLAIRALGVGSTRHGQPAKELVLRRGRVKQHHRRPAQPRQIRKLLATLSRVSGS